MYFWSHYGGAHKGFALNINLMKMSFHDRHSIAHKFSLQSIHPVCYTNELDKAFKIKNNMNQRLYHCLIKSKDWLSEKEWRIIQQIDNKKEDQQIDNQKKDYFVNKDFKNKISAIYLGVDFEFKEEAKQFIKKFNTNITTFIDLYQMKINNEKFKLEAENYRRTNSKNKIATG